jgi:hypothetical protein
VTESAKGVADPDEARADEASDDSERHVFAPLVAVERHDDRTGGAERDA